MFDFVFVLFAVYIFFFAGRVVGGGHGLVLIPIGVNISIHVTAVLNSTLRLDMYIGRDAISFVNARIYSCKRYLEMNSDMKLIDESPFELFFEWNTILNTKMTAVFF